MVESKGWNWNIVKEDFEEVWKNPSIESFYLVNRWKSQDKKDFLDLGCGLGRHSILFGKNGFNVYCLDISENAIDRTRKWAEEEKIECNYKIGDMLELPYKDESIDVIYSRNVISHTDTEGVKKSINEIKRVLRKNGECYLTLCSKETWGFKQTDWTKIDENTKLRMEDGPEYKVPHFYADYDLIKELFKDFKIELINHIEDFYEDKGKLFSSYHYHVLVKKM
ncbi:MAG: class I SAM-dependent methyltransferase [Clostridia bacterium]|jgi:SAM-dependent methyltransferase|nr:class I SAM-dependent methyltransferase [Clostridia bacterium]